MEKAKMSNIEVTGCYQDIGYSGSDLNRPDLQRMLQDHKAGQFTAVLVYNSDRLLKGDPVEFPTWPFLVLSATPASSLEHESVRIAQYIKADRTEQTGKESLKKQRKDLKRLAKKYGYR